MSSGFGWERCVLAHLQTWWLPFGLLLGDLLSQGLSQKDPQGGNTEEGDKERKGVHCGEGITETNCFSSNNSLLKLTNNEPGPFAIHFADEKTKPQERECHFQGSQLVGG